MRRDLHEVTFLSQIHVSGLRGAIVTMQLKLKKCACIYNVWFSLKKVVPWGILADSAAEFARGFLAHSECNKLKTITTFPAI